VVTAQKSDLRATTGTTNPNRDKKKRIAAAMAAQVLVWEVWLVETQQCLAPIWQTIRLSHLNQKHQASLNTSPCQQAKSGSV